MYKWLCYKEMFFAYLSTTRLFLEQVTVLLYKVFLKRTCVLQDFCLEQITALYKGICFDDLSATRLSLNK